MGAAQALVAIRRLLTFFQGEELDLAAVERTPGGEAFALTVKARFTLSVRSNADIMYLSQYAKKSSLVGVKVEPEASRRNGEVTTSLHFILHDKKLKVYSKR